MSEEGTRATAAPPSSGSTSYSIHHLADGWRSLPIFDGVEEQVTEALIRQSEARQYRAGSVIVHGGQALDGLLIVQRGIIELAHVEGKHERGVLLLSSKDLLFPSTLFHEPALVSARALTTAKLVVVDLAAVENELRHSAVLAKNLLKAMSGQWRMAVRNILDLNCRSAAQRLCAFLVHLADLQADADQAVLPIPKRHLATRLGMTAETLSRALQVVADHGVYLRGRAIIVRDRSAVENFCGPSLYGERDERSLDVFAL